MLLFFFWSIVIVLLLYFILVNLNFRFIAKSFFGDYDKKINKRKIELAVYVANFKIIKIDLLKHKEKIDNIIIKQIKKGKHKFRTDGKNIFKLIKWIEIIKLDFNFSVPEPCNIDGYFNIILKLKVIHIVNMLKTIIYERGKLKKDERTSNRRFNAYCNGKH